MNDIDVEGLVFSFDSGLLASKYDDWRFYRNHFLKLKIDYGIKAVDLLVVDSDKTAWLVEVKDYRMHARTKPSDLGSEVAQKVLSTLSAMIPCKLKANEDVERKMAAAVTRAKRLRVVLHLEQPAKHSKLWPRAISPADVQQKLRRLLKPIDAHPLVVEMSAMGTLAWAVRSKVA